LIERYTDGGEGVKLMGLWLEAMRISGWQGCGDDVVRGGSIDNGVVDGFSDVVIEINCYSRRVAISSLHSFKRWRNSIRHSFKFDIVGCGCNLALIPICYGLP
jgi:hypothetical protein